MEAKIPLLCLKASKLSALDITADGVQCRVVP